MITSAQKEDTLPNPAHTAVEEELHKPSISVIALIDALISHAAMRNASDVHIAPSRDHLMVRFRIDGLLEDMHWIPLHLHSELIARIKILAGLRIDEHQAAQDGRFRFEPEPAVWTDVRVSIVPTYYGENAVLRLLALGTAIGSLGHLGFSAEHLAILKYTLKEPSGMVLATGPTGSGKTTTLYGLLCRIAQRNVSVVSIEDPVEYSIDGISQIQANDRTGLTFANGLRSILRQDPDIIMVGEIRDTETAKLAATAALTGHFVLSSIHTSDALSVLVRLHDLGVEPYLIASTISLVIAQRLVRRICEGCKVAQEVSPIERAFISGVLPTDAAELMPPTLLRGRGCAVCNGMGYRGRVGIYELLVIDNSIRSHIAPNLDARSFRKLALEQGFTPMVVDGVRKAIAGITTLDEIRHLAYT